MYNKSFDSFSVMGIIRILYVKHEGHDPFKTDGEGHVDGKGDFGWSASKSINPNGPSQPMDSATEFDRKPVMKSTVNLNIG